MFHYFLKCLVLLAFFEFLTAFIEDPCDEKWCPNQGTHVRCNKSGDFSSDCIGDSKLEDMTNYIDLILERHNYYRNLVAGGEVEGLDPAVRMPVIKSWDPELTLNAEYNAESCVFAHDPCRSTEKFCYAGQNIYYAKTSNLNISIEDYIIEALEMWYAEHEYANSTLIESFYKTTPQTGHFTTLVNDHQIALGCACLNNLQTTSKGLRRMIIFTCDYSSTNMRGYPTYIAGPTASECEITNAQYPALCDGNFNLDYINWYCKV